MLDAFDQGFRLNKLDIAKCAIAITRLYKPERRKENFRYHPKESTIIEWKAGTKWMT